jgi:hypothetical protein
MSDVIFLYRYTRRWILFPKWRSSVSLIRSVHAAWPTLSASDIRLVFRYTRRWIHYGLFAHIGICTVIGAVEGVFGR